MKEYTFQKTVSKNDEYDVIVVGGGPAGCAAAAQAARSGANVLLIEATGCLGGMGTMGMVPAWCPMTDGEKVIYSGIALEVYERACSLYPHEIHGMDWTPIEPEGLKRTYDELIENSGADVMFGSVLSDVITKNGHVEAIIVTNKSGLCAYCAKTYIDATGDGDLAAWAGADYRLGGENGETQLATLCFSVANVNEQSYLNSPSLHYGINPDSPIKQWAESKEYPHIVDKHCCQNLTSRGMVGFNANHVYDVDAADPKSLSKAYLEGRKIAWSISDALKKYVPEAFGSSYMGATAPLMGIRESRRIIGDYVLNADDYYARRSFDDEISRCCYYIDIHTKEGSSGKLSAQESSRREARYEKGESYGVPYRCLTPKGLDNVLTAGRCISTDRAVLASVRIMPACLTTGQAAGAAAALANGGDVHKVDTDALRSSLKKAGAYFK